MKKETYILFIVTILQTGFVCYCRSAYAEVLPDRPSHSVDKQCLEQFHKPIMEHYAPADSNQPAIPKNIFSSKLTNDELRTEIYKEGLECFRREMDNYKWIIQFSLSAIGIIVAIAAILVTIEIYKLRNKVGKTEEVVKVTDLWDKAGVAYSIGHYEDAVEIWRQIYEKFKPNNRQFFNNWGSSLLHLAKQKEKRETKEKLLLEAAEKYKKAEDFTRGIAAYNLASIYSLLNKEEECKKWLEIAKETGRILPKEKFEKDEDFKNMREKRWFSTAFE